MPEYPVVKLEIYVPEDYIEPLGDALAELGAGRIGAYDHCMSVTRLTGFWRPLPGAQPYLGDIGRVEAAPECKLEINCPWELVPEALRRIRQIHPYEEPLIQVVPLLNHLFPGGK